MAVKTTRPYRSTLAGSIGAGMGSVFNPNSRRYYVLEHKVTSKYHRAGEAQEIIVDQIEMGRDSRCQVRFDDKFSTVSRRHAAIVKDGDNWKLVQISKTNTTLLNGHPVKTEWYLQNGDEIQLSVNGPKLGFIVPTGKKATVGSIGLTRRLSLFRQQALRPYKQAIAALSCVLVLSLGIGGYFLASSMAENKRLAQLVENQKKEMEENRKKTEAVIDSVKAQNVDLTRQMAEFKKNGGGRRSGGSIQHVSLPKVDNNNTKADENSSPKVNNNKINECIKDVYFILDAQYVITLPDGSSFEITRGEEGFPGGFSGTGFILKNGTFVTARHVARPWDFWKDGSGVKENMLLLNRIVNNGGKVVCKFVATSSSGKQFVINSDQFIINNSTDVKGNAEDGTKLSLAQIDETDFAYAKSPEGGKLAYDASKSNTLERGTKLTILGFPLSLGGSANPSKVSPKYSEAICADNGLNDGVILTTATTFEQGNSGGPAFYTDKDGNLVVIGIISAGAGRSTGFIVPISKIK